MPDFVYCGDEGRVYPSLPAPANSPEPGQSYKLAADPGDGRWTPATGKSKAAQPAPDPQPADPAPAGDNQE